MMARRAGSFCARAGQSAKRGSSSMSARPIPRIRPANCLSVITASIKSPSPALKRLPVTLPVEDRLPNWRWMWPVTVDSATWPEMVRDAGREVRPHDVRRGREAVGDLDGGGLREVEGDAALVAVDAEEGGPQPLCRAFPAHRRGAPHVVAGLRLDLDHLGPKQGKLVRAERPGDIAGEIEDAGAGKGLVHVTPSVIPAKAGTHSSASRITAIAPNSAAYIRMPKPLHDGSRHAPGRRRPIRPLVICRA